MRHKQTEVITCPKCGYEYLPCEIYVPKAFFGTPTNIKRDEQGKIIDFSGVSIDNAEYYTCDSCNTTFRVTARLNFVSDIKESRNFNDDYCDTFQQESLFTLEE